MIYTRHHKRAAATRAANRAVQAAELAIVNGTQPRPDAAVAEVPPQAAQQQQQPVQQQNKHQQRR